MTKEELIKKWLDNNLTSEEQKAFDALDESTDLIKLNNALSSFKAPEFSANEEYIHLKSQLKVTKKKTTKWFYPVLRIAAVIALLLRAYYYTTTLDTEIQTKIAEQTNITLPDASEVNLNVNSFLAFNESKWDDSRVVNLVGEAFFKVAKGKKFNVITKYGTVTVLGTEFNVTQRNSYFEVTCFEGLVAVTHNENRIELSPSNSFRWIDGKVIVNEKVLATQPSWLRGESSYNKVSLKHILSELENYYDIEINAGDIDTSRLFTGSFTHKNLDLALKSVTIPLNLSYSKTGATVVLKRE